MSSSFSFQHYEDLRSVFSRMAAILPGQSHANLTNKRESPWDWRDLVIEAKPVCVLRLIIPQEERARALFNGYDIPSKHQTSTSRRWFVAERTQVETAEWEEGSSGVIPEGVALWHASDQAKQLIVLAMHDAADLFGRQVMECTLPAHDEWRTSGRLTLFATPGPAQLCLRDSVGLLLAADAPYLARLAQQYAQSIAWMYGVDEDWLEVACRLHVTWHAGAGAWPARLAPASPCRYENGPIVLVAVGQPVVTHDMVPALLDASTHADKESPVRLDVGEGVMMCVDGSARMRYSHGCYSKRRHGGRTPKNWFTFTFFLDCTRLSQAVGYDRETRSLVMATPVQGNRVVMACEKRSSTPKTSEGLRLDSMGVLVKDMRLCLRAAESHLLAARCLEQVPRKSSSSSLSSIVLEKSSNDVPITMFLNSASSSTNGSEGTLPDP